MPTFDDALIEQALHKLFDVRQRQIAEGYALAVCPADQPGEFAFVSDRSFVMLASTYIGYEFVYDI